MWIDLQADLTKQTLKMTKLIVAFRNYAKTPKNELFRAVIVCAIRGGVNMLFSFRSA